MKSKMSYARDMNEASMLGVDGWLVLPDLSQMYEQIGQASRAIEACYRRIEEQQKKLFALGEPHVKL